MAPRGTGQQKPGKPVSRETLLRQVRDLRHRLAEAERRREEAEQALEAIRTGAVDAVVVGSPQGERIFTLHGAEQSYRLLIETVSAAALTVALDGTVMYANRQAAAVLNMPLEQLIGAPFEAFVVPDSVRAFHDLFAAGQAGEAAGEVRLMAADRHPVPVHLALRRLDTADQRVVCLVATDLTERQQAEAALRRANEELEARVAERTAVLAASEAKFAALFHGSPVGITVSTLDGRLLDVNDTMLEMAGYAADDLARQTVADLTVWVDPEQRKELLRHLDAKGSVRDFAARLHKKSGETFPVIVSAHLLTLGGEQVLVSCAVDMTERKRAEEALAVQRRLFDAVLTQVPDGIVIRDAVGQLVFANPAARRDARVPPERTGLDEALRVWGETRDAAGRVIPVAEWPIAAALQGEPRCVEWHRVRGDGQAYVALNCGTPLRDDTGAIVGAVAVTSDITERKRAEDALAAQRRLLETILEQAADGIVVRDAQGRVTMANAVARRWAYRPPEGTLLEEAPTVWGGTTTREGNPLPVDEWPMHRALQGETVIGVEFHRVTPDGHHLVLTTSAAPLRGTRGELLGAVAILSDITERTGMESQLRQAVADKDTLLREVHHRVKNNLQMLCDLLYLQAEGQASPEVEEALRDASGRVYAIARLHEQLYRAMQGGAVRVADYFGRLVAGVANIYPNIPVRLDAMADEVCLDLDRAIHAGLIVNELVTNALKHAFPAGRQGSVTVRVGTHDGHVEVQVRDTGKGLPPGLGLEDAKTLGLRIVHILARRLNASVQVEKTDGTTFTLTFPLYADTPVEPRHA